MPKGIQQVNPSSLLQGESVHVRGIDSDIDDLKILGSPFRTAVSDAILSPGITVTRSIDEATYLTIPLADDSGELRQSKLLQSAFTLELDGLYFRHAGLDRNEDGSITLRPRSREVAKLMAAYPEDGKADKVFRGKWTRAEFIYKLVSQVRPLIPFYCPELHTRQPIKSEREARADKDDRKTRRDKGVDSGAKLTVKGVAATAEQIALGDRMMRVGESVGASDEGLVGLITAAINESLIKNLTYGDASSTGPLQVLSSTAANLGIDARNIEQIVDAFFTRGFTGAGGMNELLKSGTPLKDAIGLVMYSANGTTYPGLQYIPEAEEWVEAFGGTASMSSATEIEVKRRYAFERKPGENTWAAMKRLGDEVNWRRFEASGIVFYIAETDLLNSEPRMRVSEDALGIEGISWRYDSPRKAQEVSVTAHTKAWAAPPGTVAVVSGEGQADGRYIVAEVESLLGDNSATITLRRPTPPLPEPAAETTTKTVGGFNVSDTGDGSGNSAVDTMVEEAERIDKLSLTYVYGGGHVTPAPANGPFDCSSAVSRLLQVAGYDIATSVSGTLAGMFESGAGENCTIYANPEHVLIQLNGRFWGTSSENPGGGPGWISDRDSGYLSGFTARHPKGL